MKLIVEHIDEGLESVVEEVGGKKNLYIEGIFLQADLRNRNKRIYPMGVMKEAVGLYDENFIQKKRSVGELNHPEGPRINLDKVSHQIESLRFDGKNVIGKALILEDMPMGKIAKTLIESGVQLGVSSRGLGDINHSNGTMRKFIMNTVDIVHDPSAPESFVNGVMEGIEYFVDADGEIGREMQEEIKKVIDKTPKSQMAIAQAVCFREFINKIALKQ